MIEHCGMFPCISITCDLVLEVLVNFGISVALNTYLMCICVPKPTCSVQDFSDFLFTLVSCFLLGV